MSSKIRNPAHKYVFFWTLSVVIYVFSPDYSSKLTGSDYHEIGLIHHHRNFLTLTNSQTLKTNAPKECGAL